MFDKAQFYNYRVSTRIGFFGDIIQHCNRYDVATLLILSELEALSVCFDECNGLFVRLSKSQLTALLKEGDERRDQYFVGLRLLFKSYMLHFDVDMVHAATRLLEEVDKYGSSIEKMAYSNETTVLRNICIDILDNEELKAYADLLHATNIVEKIQAENEQFSQWYNERQHEEGSRDTAKVAEKLEEAVLAYQKLLDTIFAHCILNDKTAYQPLVQDINATIAEYNTNEAIRKRESKTSEPAE